MVTRGGRCLCTVLILTGFLLGATNGQTTMAPAPATTLAFCTNSPCQNGGTCMEGTDTCQCAPGYNGDNCEPDLCALLACQNGGTCDTTTNPVSCMYVDECTGGSDPCVTTPGVCINNAGSFTCMCNTGYELQSGSTTICDDVDECYGGSNPCDSRSVCMNSVGSFNCTCNTGYEHPTGSTTICNDIDECMSGPCMNGGICVDMISGYTCYCPDGFNGTQCEFDIDACDPNPCDNGATCTNHLMNPGGVNYTCVCIPGWTGRKCSEDFRECESMPCRNGGICVDGQNYYNCACPPGFKGSYCEHICPAGTFGDYCMESCTCVDGANCSNVDGSCTCDPAFEGAVCDISEVKVTARRTSNDTIPEGDDFTLACQVNLAGMDLDEVAWYRDSVELPNETGADYMVDSNATMGMYNITILSADAVDIGTYRCTAVTKENQFNASSEDISVDVVVRGKIDLELSKLDDYIQINQTASLICTVFSSSEASIAWERNGVSLVDGMDRTRIEPSQEMGTGGTYFFSVLNVSNIVRGDNGIYRCLAFDGAGSMTDSAHFNIFVQEVAELANPEYLDVRSKRLQLVWNFTVQGNDDGISCTARYGIQGTNETEQDVGGTSPGVPVTDLEPYTPYKFQLICVNLAGSSQPLDFPPQETLAGEPSQPRNVRISSIQARQVFVEWDEPVVTNGPIGGYLLIARGGIEDLTYTTLGSGTSTVYGGLTPYTTYMISIHAFNNNIPEGIQLSVESSPSEPFRTSEAAPGKPAVLTINDTPTECIISWIPPSEPNGVITKYTLYTEVLRMGTYAVYKTFPWEVPGSQLQITFMKAELAPFSIFRYSVTASTAPGEGVNATTTDTCETPQGVPVEPDTIPSPSDNAISQTSFMTTLPPHDARNGPISCCEVIVVELQSGDADLDSSDPRYSPAQIMSYKEAQNIIGTPYSAVVFSNCPTEGVKVVIGATTSNVSTCYTGGSTGIASRRRRQTTGANTLTAVNGPLNTGGIYSIFVRVYTPSPEDPQMAFYESGPFMVPVTLKSSGTPVTLTIVSVTVILVLICVIMIFICIRKRKRSRQQGNRSSPIASASFTTTPRMCTNLLPANSPTSSGNQQVEDVYHDYERVCVCGQDSAKSSTRANQGTSQGISLTKTKSTSENGQSHDYENPSFDDKEYTDLDFSQVKKGGDPTKPTSSGKEYTDLDFSKIEKGGDPTKSFDGKEDVDPAYEVCII